MPVVQSFEPVIGTNPQVLILGSMPGIASLKAQQYYAHPRNAFWPIMSELFGVQWTQSYESRINQIKTLPLVLWDVLRFCHREGSLDADIREDHMQPNAIPHLLAQHPSISLVCFNGATSEKIFKQRVTALIPDIQRLKLIRLPSTSPAHASLTLAQKTEAWSEILQHVELT
jgi:hypoxanthine-DNA glycosylase